MTRKGFLITLSDKEKTALAHAATRANRPLATWIREVALDAIHQDAATVKPRPRNLATAAFIKPRPRILTVPALDKVLGSGPVATPGLVVGSTVLLRGPKGIGKSALALTAACASGRKVVYACGDMTKREIFDYAQRIGLAGTKNMTVIGSDDACNIEEIVEASERAEILIVDSLSTAYMDNAGSNEQMIAVAIYTQSFARQRNVAVILINHGDTHEKVTHLSDAVVKMSAGRGRERILEIDEKNRFGDSRARAIWTLPDPKRRPPRASAPVKPRPRTPSKAGKRALANAANP